LLVRGPVVMDGYHRNAVATAEVMTDGWLRTGDIATRDDDGFYFIVDRAKDMILTAGYNIYPAELERVLAEHDAVSLVAVAGIPDSLKGETPCAWVVLKSGQQADEQALLMHCREKLAAYKVPRRIVFTNDLPRTSTGKILRRALAQTLEDAP
jgi:long-chain acyl-CoA synthetase